MRSLSRPFTGLCAGLGLSLAAMAAAQPAPLTLPEASPEASISQAVGLTKIRLEYHRPAVNARNVWGDLVPWGEVWRAGANENTTIAFSTPVTVQGKTLPEGTYGLHVLPVENGDWAIIFSRVHWAWGSLSYDPKEDAARISVRPKAAELQERLAYTFDDPTEKNVTVTLRWEKVALPFAVEVDTPAVVVESLRRELRGLPRFFWQGWNQAAAYCLRNKVNLEEALQWADRSIETNETFANLRTKKRITETLKRLGA